MSHITGKYTFNLGPVEHYWNNSLKTGVSRLYVELNASFDGVDENGIDIHEDHKSFGFKRFKNPISYDYLTDNLDDICNTFLVNSGFYEVCELMISGKIHNTTPVLPGEMFVPEINVPVSFTGIKNL